MRRLLCMAMWTAAVNTASRLAERRLRVSVVAAALLCVLGATVVASPAVAQDSGADAVEVRITARKLANGKVEFGLQQRQGDDAWGDRQLPDVRLFPTTAGVDRWLVSSSLAVGDAEVRITARKLANGKVEFGLQQRQGDDAWGDRQLPEVRLFPTTAAVGRWLVSSSLSISIEEPTTTTTTAAPTVDYSMPLDADWDAEFWRLNDLAMSADCLWGFEIEQCTTPDGDSEYIIQGTLALFNCDLGLGLDFDFVTSICNGMSLEEGLQHMRQLVCLEDWYFSYRDWQCHSTYQRR